MSRIPSPPKSAPRFRLILALLLLSTALCSCAQNKEQHPALADKKKAPIPVLTVKAKAADVPVEFKAMGLVESSQSSPVRSQIGGILTGIRFQEGDFVQAGQLLFVIDPAPLQASRKQLRANLARDEAEVKNSEAQTRSAEAKQQNAETTARRYLGLVQQDLVAREQYDQLATALTAAQTAKEASQAAALAAQATVEATKAALESIEIQLGYTEIRSPIAGQTGALQAKTGDLIKANDTTPLVVVNQLEPLRVRFSANETRLAEIMRAREDGDVTVNITPPGGGTTKQGRLVFVDNAVDSNSATVALKAELPNQDHGLWPGQFVEATVTLRTIAAALLVPSSAVLTGQKGPYLYVVDAEGVAVVRPIVVGIEAGEETVVSQGLRLGETVVTDGQLRLTPGAKVVEKSALTPDKASTAKSPPAKSP